jgi:hypothetical protein
VSAASTAPALAPATDDTHDLVISGSNMGDALKESVPYKGFGYDFFRSK